VEDRRDKWVPRWPALHFGRYRRARPSTNERPRPPADKKIRFRSSTNVEDAGNFSGAGLYDSFSGCLADDLDEDNLGPSICDPRKPKERGAIRAIKKVLASFYNENAFLERLRHDIDEKMRRWQS